MTRFQKQRKIHGRVYKNINIRPDILKCLMRSFKKKSDQMLYKKYLAWQKKLSDRIVNTSGQVSGTLSQVI